MTHKKKILYAIAFESWMLFACSDPGQRTLSYDDNGVNANSSTSSSSGLFDERDGKTYKIVQIGDQTWMAENLNFGTKIKGMDSASNQSDSSRVEKYCHNDDDTNCNTDGGLYQWAEAMALPFACNSDTTPNCGGTINSNHHQGICPKKWHLPKETDWNLLIGELGGLKAAGSNMKLNTTGISAWDDSTYNKGNSFGFSARPAGNRNENYGFNTHGINAFFWEASEKEATKAYNRYLGINNTQDFNAFNQHKLSGFSVRCVRDN